MIYYFIKFNFVLKKIQTVKEIRRKLNLPFSGHMSSTNHEYKRINVSVIYFTALMYMLCWQFALEI